MNWRLRDPDTAAVEIDPHQEVSFRRRSVLLGLTTIGTIGIGGFSRRVNAQDSNAALSFESSKVLVITNVSALNSVTIYYLDSEGARQMETISSLTNKIDRDPLKLRYARGNDQATIQVKGRTSLVLATAAGPNYRNAVTNSKAKRVPSDFNSPPEAAFTVSTTEPEIGTTITFTSTATDPDFPEEQLTYDWDLNGDGHFETHGTNVSYTYESSDRVTVAHRVTDAFGKTDTAQRIITPQRSGLFERLTTLTAPNSAPGDGFGGSVSLDGDTALISGRGAEEFEEGMVSRTCLRE